MSAAGARSRPGGGLPHRGAARAGDADPAARRFRGGRRGASRGLRRRGRAMAARGRSGQSLCLARLHRPLQDDRPLAAAVAAGGRPARTGGAGRRRAGADDARSRRRRRTAADLHLLPSGFGAGCAHRAHLARSRRPDHRGDRAGLSGARADHRPAHRPRQGENPRRGDPLRGAGARRPAGAARERPAGDLPDLQRRLRGDRGAASHPRRSLRRGDPARPAGRRAAGRARGARPARPDAAARGATRRRASTQRAISFCWRIRTARYGTAPASPRRRA